jgi:hypothetical protein
LAAANSGYGVAEGEGDGEALSLFFFGVSFFMVEESVDDFLVVMAASFFWVDDFLVIDSFLAGAFSGAVVVVDSDLVVHELISPAANKAVME